MIVDNAPTNLGIHWISRGGDTGRRRAEHRSILQLRSLTSNMRFRS
jgi:hypothetical protein